NFILGKPNSASSKTSLSASIADRALKVTNTSTAAGATALGLTTASGHPPFTVNSDAKVTSLNADKLDGHDATSFGQVRDFSRSIAAASAGPPTRDMLTFKGLTLSSLGFFAQNPFELGCILYASATDAGQIDNSLIYHDPN